MMDLGVPTRQWQNYRAGSLKDEFGQDEFRNSAKRRKMHGQQAHVEGNETVNIEEPSSTTAAGGGVEKKV